MVVTEEKQGEFDGSRQQTHRGSHVVLVAGDLDTQAASALLNTADLVYVQIARMIKPAEQPDAEPLTIVLTSAEADVKSRSASPDGVQSGPFRVEILSSQISNIPIATSLTNALAIRWYGNDVSAATGYLEGVAGLAAALSGTGPSIEEADKWTAAQIKNHKAVSLYCTRDEPELGEVKESEIAQMPFNLAALSFLAFLNHESDPDAARRYLAGFDSGRQDQAAINAYHHPLAVLEEEWLNRLKKNGRSADTFFTFVRQILPLLKPYRWKQAEILVYLILAAGYNIVQPYAIKIFIDRVTHELHRNVPAQAGAIFVSNLAPFLATLVVIYLVNGVVSLRRAYTVNWLNQNVLNMLQMRMYQHLQRLSHSFYNNAKVGDLMARINDDLDSVQTALSQVTNKALYQCFTVMGALIALFMLTRKSPLLAVPILLIIPLFVANYVALRTRNKQASREQRKRVGQASTAIHQDLVAHSLIKAFCLENRMFAAYRDRVLSLQKSKLKLALLSAVTDLSEDMTTAIAQLMIFGLGGYLVLRGQGSGVGVGDLSALLVLVKSIFSPIASLSGIGQTIQQATGSMERVSELLKEPVTIADSPDAFELGPLAREIRFENVTFGYDVQRPVLRDLSFTIPAGSHIAVVGPSGSGKSTLVNLLLRFWDADSGRILFDGNDLRDVSVKSVREQIGLVFQETFILDTTLRANIAIGRPEATDAEIVAAAKAAQLDTFIESLPAGYDTIPGENGAKLSVGQKQRIAIARVFLRNPPILILDEATSALDAAREASVLETLSKLAIGRTTLSITHRIAQAVTADRIYVVNDHGVAEEGTHEQLIDRKGFYYQLFRQASEIGGRGGDFESEPKDEPLKATVDDKETVMVSNTGKSVLSAVK